MSAIVDFSKLPPPAVIETLDYESILAARKTRLIELTPVDQRAALAATLDLSSEPIVKLLEENAYETLLLRQRINAAAVAVMLPYSRGKDLDNLTAFFGVQRLVVVEAAPTASPPVAAVMEDDDALLDRTQNAFDGLSIAGPYKAYEFHARSADGRVADASCISPAPCDILITVLGNGDDGVAPQALLDIVKAKLSDEDKRPVGDRLQVQSANVIFYEIIAELIVKDAGPENEVILPIARENAEKYAAERRRLGRSIYRGKIDSVLGIEGVENVNIISPAQDIRRDRTQAAICTGITLTVKREDEA